MNLLHTLTVALLMGPLVEGLRLRKPIQRKKSKPQTQESRVVCYYSDDDLSPNMIDLDLCTHIIFTPVSIQSLSISVPDHRRQDSLKKLASMKGNVRVYVNVGSDDESNQLIHVASTKKNRRAFVNNVIQYLKRNSLDGIELTWPDVGPIAVDNFFALLKGLRNSFIARAKKLRKSRRFAVTVSIHEPDCLRHPVNFAELSKYADIINLATYDFRPVSDMVLKHPAPLYSSNNHPASVDSLVSRIISPQVDSKKLTLGIPAFGYYYKLSNEEKRHFGNKAADLGLSSLGIPGVVAYNSICRVIKQMASDPGLEARYSYKGKTWVAFDDEDAVREKAGYVRQHNMGGLNFWKLDFDDHSGNCTNDRFPLVRAGKTALM